MIKPINLTLRQTLVPWTGAGECGPMKIPGTGELAAVTWTDTALALT